MSSTGPIKLLIVDDHPVVRDGLSGMFACDPGFEVVGEAGDGAEAVRLALVLAPDVILMDLRMPGMDGVTAITELARHRVTARVLVLTTYDTDGHVLSGSRSSSADSGWHNQPGGGSQAVHQRGHGQDASAAHLCQARGR